jgi:hypothetical protein
MAICSIEKPTHHEADKVIADIEVLCASFDAVRTLGITGGDVLLHPDFDRIVEYAVQQPKIRWASPDLNGVLVPSERQFAAMNHGKVVIHLSNYPSLSRGFAAIRDKCAGSDMHCVEKHIDKWVHNIYTPPVGRGREALLRHCKSCQADCPTIYDGKLYRCGMLMNWAKNGMIPESADEYLDLSNSYFKADKNRLTEEIQRILCEDYPFRGCDYCRGYSAQTQTGQPAVQMTFPKESK